MTRDELFVKIREAMPQINAAYRDAIGVELSAAMHTLKTYKNAHATQKFGLICEATPECLTFDRHEQFIKQLIHGAELLGCQVRLNLVASHPSEPFAIKMTVRIGPGVQEMRVIEQGDCPFRWWRLETGIDADQVRGAVANIPPADWPGWVRYSNEIEQKKRTTRDLGSQHYAINSLSSQINSSIMAWNLGRIAGIESCMPDIDLHGAGLHITDPGGWLQVHVDYELHPRVKGWERRLNLILWLNSEWKPQWGGALLLCNENGVTVREFYPKAGEAVLFEAGPASYHGAMQTTLDAPPRVTLAAYYLAPARTTATRRRALFMPNRDAPECPREVKMD